MLLLAASQGEHEVQMEVGALSNSSVPVRHRPP